MRGIQWQRKGARKEWEKQGSAWGLSKSAGRSAFICSGQQLHTHCNSNCTYKGPEIFKSKQMRQQNWGKRTTTFPITQTEGRTQSPPALGQETGSSTGSCWSPWCLPCPEAWVVSAHPEPHHGCKWLQRWGGRGKGRLDTAAMPGWRGGGQAGIRATPRGCGSVSDPLHWAVPRTPGGNCLPRGQSKHTTQPGTVLQPLKSHPHASYKNVYSLEKI